MAHIKSLKERIGPDLNGLITHITGCQEGSEDFRRYSESAWSNILHRNVPSVNDRQVQKNAYEFIDKFKFHNFPQKAKNLKLLLDEYSKLSYFKKYTSGDVQWGLVKLLIDLSYKPTSALEDDKPLTPLREADKESKFDWGSYLREGFEKFRLPSSSEEEFSDINDEEPFASAHLEVSQASEVFLNENQRSQAKKNLTDTTSESLKSERHELKEALRDASDAEKWLKTNVQYGWWDDPCFREPSISSHPIANCTADWEKQQKELADNEDLPFQDFTIISEYKVMREIIWVLGIPSECYIIRKDGNRFLPREGVATPTIIPEYLSNILLHGVCHFLPFILELQQFSQSILYDLSYQYPFTFNAYASCLSQIMRSYFDKLGFIENRIIKQEETITLVSLLDEITPWLSYIKGIYSIHKKAVYEDWKSYPKWQYSFRLIAVLYHHLQWPKNWLDHGLLDLFLGTFRPYTRIIGHWLGNVQLLDMEDEFIITRPKDEPQDSHVTVRDFPKVIQDLGPLDIAFWDKLVLAVLRAGTAIDFLAQLHKEDTVRDPEWFLDSFFNGFLETLEDSLLQEALIELPSQPLNNHPFDRFKKSGWFTPFSSEVAPISVPILKLSDTNDNRILTGSLMDECFKGYVKSDSLYFKVPSCKYLLKLKSRDLRSVNVCYHIQRNIEKIILRFVPSRGFVKEILLTEFKLLENLEILRKVYFLQAGRVMHLFCSLFFFHLDNKTLGTVSWNSKLNEFLSEEMPLHASMFTVELHPHLNTEICLTMQQELNCLCLEYKPKEQLNIVITKSTIRSYNSIFQFLLQLKWALFNLYKINFKDIKETDENRLRLRRLYSLRMWMLSTMTSLHSYFMLMRSVNFDLEMTHVCEEARDVKVILSVHEKGLESWKEHCFISEGHPATETLQQLFSLCIKLRLFWELESNGYLGDYKIPVIENEYSTIVMSLAEALKILANKPTERYDNFGILYDDIMNNIPVQ